MKLSRAAKVGVGLLTLFVLGIPFLIVAIVFLALFPSMSSADPSGPPSALFEVGFPLMFLLICFISIANYGLIAFYLAHIIKNPTGSDVLRIILGIAIFFFPLLGMPTYFLIYVWPDTPPSWALQPLPQPPGTAP